MAALDTTLRGLTGYQLQRTTGAAMARYKVVFAAFGLRRTTFSCLSLVIDNEGLRQSQLGKTLSIERPNLVGIVDDLIQAGLIRREVAKEDRRAYSLYPTQKGAALFGEALEAVRALDAEVAAGLPEAALSELHSALRTVERNCVKCSDTE